MDDELRSFQTSLTITSKKINKFTNFNAIWQSRQNLLEFIQFIITSIIKIKSNDRKIDFVNILIDNLPQFEFKKSLTAEIGNTSIPIRFSFSSMQLMNFDVICQKCICSIDLVGKAIEQGYMQVLYNHKDLALIQILDLLKTLCGVESITLCGSEIINIHVLRRYAKMSLLTGIWVEIFDHAL